MNITRYLSCAMGMCLIATACSSSDDASEPEGSGRTALGGTCLRSSECEPVAGKEVACLCSADSEETVCVLLPEPGEPCGSGEIGCRSDSLCISRGGPAQCEAFAKLGESCEKARCAAGTTCQSGKCAAPIALGEPCDSFEEQPCVKGAYCSFGANVCKPMVAVGQECDGADSCDGICVSTGGPQVCYAYKADGETCELSWQCRDGSSCSYGDGGTEQCTPKTKPETCGSSW